MNAGTFVFSQITDKLPMHTFRRCTTRYQGNRYIKPLSLLDQYLCIAFAHLTYRERLRDIEECLRALKDKLYHMGVHGGISRSALADTNECRDSRIYADFAQALIRIARHSIPTWFCASSSTSASATHFTFSTPAPLIYVCRFSLGHCLDPPNLPSNRIPC